MDWMIDPRVSRRSPYSTAAMPSESKVRSRVLRRKRKRANAASPIARMRKPKARVAICARRSGIERVRVGTTRNTDVRGMPESLYGVGMGELSEMWQVDPAKRHGNALCQDSNDQRPPSMVRSTGMVTSVEGFSRKGSRPRTTRSASLPGLIEPLLFSSYVAYAPLRVPTRTASSMEIRWLAPQTLPLVSVRVTWDCSAIVGSKGL